MARPLRIEVDGGWYHVTSRGTDRRQVYDDTRCYEHFLELLEEMVGRFGLILHAYVLMKNHYHLLLEAPERNVSRAMKWLNGSYSMWYNCRNGRVGPLWQGRFNSKWVDGDGSWALEASRYLHLNPVRTSRMGLGKRQAAAERKGIALPPSREDVDQRLKRLRTFPWSSYPRICCAGRKILC
jgi:REP element-mobilizing transposase RayT